MHFKLQRIMFGLCAVVAAADLAWAASGHFQIDLVAYAQLGLMSLALLAGGIFYQPGAPSWNWPPC
jgi:membrane protein implicated in regulation of membrane protease activity